MTIKLIAIAAFFMIFALSGCCQASRIDDVLHSAKREGKMVMLEL